MALKVVRQPGVLFSLHMLWRPTLLDFFKFLLALVFFTVFGPGFLSLGYQRVEIQCERTRVNWAVNCRFREHFIFGLYVREVTAEGVKHAEISVKHSQTDGDATLVSRAQVVTPSGPVPITSMSSNFGDIMKSKLIDTINIFLASPETPILATNETGFFLPFLLFGAFFTVIWLLSVVGTPLSLLFPPFLTIEKSSNTLRFRQNSWRPFLRKIPLSQIRDIEFTRRYKREGFRLALSSGERVSFANFAEASPGEIRSAVDSLREFLALKRETTPPTPLNDEPKWLTKLEEMAKGPSAPEGLPIRIDVGLAVVRDYAKKATLLVGAFFLVQVAGLQQGYFGDWSNLIISFVVLQIALSLTRSHRTEIDRTFVRMTHEGWLAPKGWEEPLENYEGIEIIDTSQSGESESFSAQLKHRRDKKKNAPLWRGSLKSREACQNMALKYSELLRVPLLSSNATPSLRRTR